MLQDRINKEFKKTNSNKKKFDENNQPLLTSLLVNPNQLLIYEVNGIFVRENLLIAPEEIENFRAINMENQRDLIRFNRISYFSGTLVREL